MHVRLSTSLGRPVVEQEGEEQIGTLAGALVHPDIGRMEGFFVCIAGFLHSTELFLPSSDILHWGHRIRIASVDVLVTLDEIVRLRALAEEGRPVLGQRILTESGMSLGRCRDVQFETAMLRLEWLFPKKFFRWRTALPVSAIVEVRTDAIVVRDLPAAEKKRSVLKTLDELTELTPGSPSSS